MERQGKLVERKPKPQQSSPIQTVAHGDIERLAKDAVPLLRVSNDLRVATRDVEDDRRRRSGDESAGFDVCGGGECQSGARRWQSGGRDVRPTQ